VRRNGGRQKPDLIEGELLAAAFGQEQVSVVDWIEGSAKNSKSHIAVAREIRVACQAALGPPY
jgi:hypothetical protein